MTTIEAPLGEVAEFIRGITFKPDDVVELGEEGSVACLRTKNVQTDLDLTDLWAIPRRFVKSAHRFVRDGDIVISTANSWNLVGKASWIPRLKWEATAGGFVSLLRANPHRVFPRYLYHWIVTDETQANLRKCARQTTNIANLSIPQAQELAIPLPPLDEQRRIAAILDQADALRRLRSRALDKLSTLGQAIFHEMFGDLIANERGFAPVVVGDVIDGFETGKNLAGDPDERPPDGFRVLKISAVTTGIFRSEESKPLPPNYEPPEAHIVRDGDLLFSRANTAQLIGATAFARTNSARLVLPDKLWRFVWKRKSKVRPEFVKALFSSPSFRYEIGKRSSGTSGSMKNIGQQKVMTIPFGLPSIDLQQEFSKRLSVVTGQAEKNQKLLETCENLFASLQHRAFKGEL